MLVGLNANAKKSRKVKSNKFYPSQTAGFVFLTNRRSTLI